MAPLLISAVSTLKSDPMQSSESAELLDIVLRFLRGPAAFGHPFLWAWCSSAGSVTRPMDAPQQDHKEHSPPTAVGFSEGPRATDLGSK